ncbi:MAG: hypothetical protein JXB85_14555 [Anaerolineales bacterium]|nr:hypothetical protein [Anaerolineales bacterium]
MKIVHKVSAYVLIGLGLLHTLLTSLFSPGFNTDALWFAGTGLGILFLGLFNLAAVRAPVRTTLDLCLAANLIGTVYGIMVVVILPAPQAFLALLAFLGAAIGIIVARRSILEETQ